MGGHGSTHSEWTPANYDKSMIDQFKSTSMGQGFGADKVDLLNFAYHGQEGTNGLGVRAYSPKQSPGSSAFTDIDLSLVNAFEAWMRDQGNSQQAWESYSALTKQQAGVGAQTILGQALSPYQSAMASQGDAMGDPKKIQSVMPTIKKTGAP